MMRIDTTTLEPNQPAASNPGWWTSLFRVGHHWPGVPDPKRSCVRSSRVYMVAYEVRVNGKKVTTAGLRKGGVISLISNWMSRPPDVSWTDGGAWDAGFRVGGLQEGRRGLDEYLTWFRKDLRIGDEIGFRLVEVGRADKPKQVERKRRKRK